MQTLSAAIPQRVPVLIYRVSVQPPGDLTVELQWSSYLLLSSRMLRYLGHVIPVAPPSEMDSLGL